MIKFYLLTLLVLSSTSVFSGQELHRIAACEPFVSLPEENIVTKSEPETKFKKGLLWKIEKNDVINHVFGTMHSQDYAVSSIPPKVRLALIKSKVLLMETIPNEVANQAFLNSMYFKDKHRLDALLEPELFEELTTLIQEYGVTKEHTNFVKPWAAFSLIGRPKPVRAPTLESNLFHVAQQGMLQVKSLETMEEIISALDGLTMDDQVTILKDTICNHEQIIRDTKILVDLYLNRDLDGIIEFNNQPHHDEAVFERFMQRIMYDRNSRIIERIGNEFKTGGVFVAIGAAHLTSKKGLLNELEERNYTISRVY